MAKMFYTLDEVATKLGKSPDDVREMARSGQIQEFRDRDKIMFKVDQIDLLAGGDEESGDIPLALEDSRLGGSGLDLQDSREGTGISVFDTDHGDASDQTQVTAAQDDELSLESVGSGSGLLDLTRESDDTSLGAELLEEVYNTDDKPEMPANASGLFDTPAADASVDPYAGMPMAAMVIEPYEGAWSGLGVGMLLGALAALVCLAVMVIVTIGGSTPQLATMFAGNLWLYAGGLIGIVVIFGLIGFFIGKATE
jgi:hypothetical protein